MQPAKDDKTHTIPLSEDSFFLKTILIIYSNPIVRNKNFFTDFLIISKLLYRPIFPVNLYPVIKKQTISSIKYRKKNEDKENFISMQRNHTCPSPWLRENFRHHRLSTCPILNALIIDMKYK